MKNEYIAGSRNKRLLGRVTSETPTVGHEGASARALEAAANEQQGS